MNGKYPKHHETSTKAITKFFENFDLLKVLKFPRGGGGSQRLGTFPKFDRFLLLKASINDVPFSTITSPSVYYWPEAKS